MIFDTHAHYDDQRFDEDRDEVLNGLRAAGVGCVLNVGASWQGSEDAVALSKKWDFIYAAVGLHPDEVGCLDEDKIAQMREWTREDKVIAIGEIGLDYHNDVEPHDVQQYWFKRQIELAREVDLPILVHSRDAVADTWDIVSREAAGMKGIIHAFSASAEMALRYVEAGFTIGMGGVVTCKNGRKAKEVVAATPLEHLVLETDAPYLSPDPLRGRRNTSANQKYVVQMIASLKGITEEEVIEQTTRNAEELFGITIDPA